MALCVEVHARLFVRAGADRVPSIGRVPSDPGGLGFGTRWRRRRFWSCRRAAAWSSGAAARPSGALHTSGAWSAGASFGASVAKPSCGCQSAVSHVIPLRLVQIVNSCRWNCNVFEVSRKMTELNYVRNLSGGGVGAAHGHRSLTLRPSGGVSPACRGSNDAISPVWSW